MKSKIPMPKKLPSGAWRIQVMVDGKRVGRTFAKPEEAVAWAASVRAGIEEAKNAPKHTSLTTAIDIYIESKSSVLSPSTIRGYRTIQKHRFSRIMKKDVYQITQLDLQRAVNEDAKRVSAKTLKNALGLVLSVLAMCGIQMSGVNLPQVIKPRKKYLQPDDVGRLIQAVEGDKCELPILLAVWLGMRRSEILGLCWDCIDTEHSTITIRRTVVPDENHQWILKETAKNTSSQRTIPCPTYIMDKIKALPRREGRLFQMHPDTIRKHVHEACAQAGITDTTVHGLRHTNAAVMKSLGVDDAHAMARGGWSSEATYKKTYSYVFDSAALSGDAAIDDYFTELHTKLHTAE